MRRSAVVAWRVSQVLASLKVLVVEDDPDTGELFALALEARGAVVRLVDSGAAAMAALTEIVPDILLCDLSLADGSGLDWLVRFRTLPGIAAVPAIAISGHASAIDRDRSLAAGYEKHLNKPTPIADIVAAITALVRTSSPQSLRPMLARLAEVTGCRYTSLLRFDDSQIVSVWTFDRTQPHVDPFPMELPIEASYCVLVQRTGALVAIENAGEDARANCHPKQHALATYLGAPVFLADGAMFGTLCSYDVAPLAIDEAAREAVLAAAREIEATLRGDARQRPVTR